MRKVFFTATAAFAFLTMATAQEPRKSPHATISAEIDGHKITITYGRPSLRGRKMIGDHEPYGKVWRTGADEATTLETDADLDINGLKVPAGKYALFTLFTPESWTLIVNKTANQWGAFKYKDADDLGRVPMNVSKSSAPVEQFTITLVPAGGNSATLKMEWENIVASVPVKAR